MTEEPYRWLEAIGNRREYVREQLKGGSPAFGVSLPEGILLLSVGGGNSKVFEIYDRHAMAGLGHPADLERIRQAVIDAAHVEAFTRAPEDVSLRRLVSFGLGPQLKASFEQIYSAPFLLELLFAELGAAQEKDLLLRLRFDGGFHIQTDGLVVAASQPEPEAAAHNWLKTQLKGREARGDAAELLLQAWWCLSEGKTFGDTIPSEADRRAGWRQSVNGRTIEIGWLARTSDRAARFSLVSRPELGL